ncbi:MAG: replication-associated recombination protein A [Clostridia bacterium]|nr:replication-associated recombination protein A [Clostridia bacterium]
MPLADKIRPKSIGDVIGQNHIVGEGKIINKVLETGNIPNMIFYGPPGVGKTTVANIIADKTNKTLYKLNATTASVKDIKEIIAGLDTLLTKDGVLLYLDEIQNFNKKQQQSLLEFTENGKITLIASTTENPYHYVYKAILSRSTVFEFYKVSSEEILRGLNRIGSDLKEDYKPVEFSIEAEVLEKISKLSDGDVRYSINLLELVINLTKHDKDGNINIKLEGLEEILNSKKMSFDMFGDEYYNILSAFQKSIRGSDANAAIHYLARLVKAGDLISICRRLLVIASEDIGLAYPSAISIVKSCTDAAKELGFPEARIPLAQATILLATSPKSNSAYTALDAALHQIDIAEIGDIPKHLKDGHYGGAKKLGNGNEYKYPHAYPNNYIDQQYLPDEIEGSIYYDYGNNKFEQASKEYMKKIKLSEN